MKAPRLRAGLVLIAVLTFASAAIVGPSPALAAEEDLQAALDDYAAGRYEAALDKLREYVASNPGNEEVYAVLRDADEKVLLRVLAKQGEHERLLKYLFDKARPEAREQTADPEQIQELVEIAVNDDSLDKRRMAGMQLRAAGDTAVPFLFPFLARSDAEVVVNAMFALHRVGTRATYPLTAVLLSDDARTAGNAAAVLGDVGDPHAIPALLRLKETSSDEAARAKAAAALQKIGGARAVQIAAANAYARLGQRFYMNDPTIVVDYDSVRNLWRWEDGTLARYQVPAYLFPYQMAEQMATDALSLDPGHKGARALLVRALLAQKVEADVITANGGDVPEALAGSFDLAASQGFDGATEALRQSLDAKDWDVAIEATKLVVQTYGGQNLGNHALGDALVAPERRVNYAAAIAALYMSPKSRLKNADKVANLAARAASERAVRQVLVIDDKDHTRSRLVMDLAHAGYVSAGVAYGADGVARAKNAPTLDVIIVRADLGNPAYTIPTDRLTSSIMVIDELKHDVRTKDMRILVLLSDTDEAKADALKEFFTNKYNDSIAGYIVTPLDTATAMETVDAAAEAGELNSDRERANMLAARAAEAFANTDFTCRSFDLSVAVEPLSTAAVEGPTPEVRLQATRALGNIRAGGAEALAKVLGEAEDDGLKAAAAAALGNVLSVQDGTPAQLAALVQASKSEGDVASAALRALGRVRGLTAEQRVKLFKLHRLPVAEKGS